jgi:hypothetical protein
MIDDDGNRTESDEELLSIPDPNGSPAMVGEIVEDGSDGDE